MFVLYKKKNRKILLRFQKTLLSALQEDEHLRVEELLAHVPDDVVAESDGQRPGRGRPRGRETGNLAGCYGDVGSNCII